MLTLKFPTHAEAERRLLNNGFAFVGAPGRWRKASEAATLYANIRPLTFSRRGGPVLVLIYTPNGHVSEFLQAGLLPVILLPLQVAQ
jgi:hypothetical protein